VWWSDETYRLLGLDPSTTAPSYEAFLGSLHPDDRAHVTESLKNAIGYRIPYFAHHRVVHADGTRRTLSSQAFVVTDPDNNPVRLVGTIQDVTERVELEREILAAGERERERIGRDVHDGLGQTLTGISLSLKALTNRLERGQEIPLELLKQVEANVQEAMNETRRVTRLLSPRVSGLKVALETLVKQFDRGGLRCTIDGQMHHAAHDPELETHLYRIAQEALSNAAKHSRALNVELRYHCDGHSIRLEVLDDGVGLPQRQRQPEGIGLKNMRYRVDMLDGVLEVEDRPNGGTRVVCSCPCRCEPADSAMPASTAALLRAKSPIR
jgi:signal transduction histidine kinase